MCPQSSASAPRSATAPGTPRHLVVIGGGISGLSAARAAIEASAAGPLAGRVNVTLLEAAEEVGGKAKSLKRDGFLVEGGPTGYLDSEPVLDRLVNLCKLTKLPASEAAARRYLVRAGRLREIQSNPLRFASSGVLSPIGLLRLAREAWVPSRQDDDDETIFDFAQRRLGQQAAERLIAPMVLGVFAGDARQLSLPAAFPRMRELELKYGSLLGAMRKLKREGRAKGQARGGPSGPGAPLTSFEGGLQSLPKSLAKQGGFEVRTSQTVTGLKEEQGEWILSIGSTGESIRADGLVIATEPWAAAKILPEPLCNLRDELDAIFCPPVAVVALAYEAKDAPRVPVGFGALISRAEKFNILGVLFDTHLFGQRSPDGKLLMRAMLGGAVDPEMATRSPEELVEITRADLKRLLGLDAVPIFREVVRWPRAIPQYTLGHRARVARIEAEVKRWNEQGQAALALGGNALDGVAFGKAAARGWRAGESVVATWTQAEGNQQGQV